MLFNETKAGFYYCIRLIKLLFKPTQLNLMQAKLDTHLACILQGAIFKVPFLLLKVHIDPVVKSQDIATRTDFSQEHMFKARTVECSSPRAAVQLKPPLTHLQLELVPVGRGKTWKTTIDKLHHHFIAL